MAYGFNNDRSKADMYTAADLDDIIPVSAFSSASTVKDAIDKHDNLCSIDYFGADPTGNEYSDDAVIALIAYVLSENLYNVYITCKGGYYKFANTIDFSSLDGRVASVDFKGGILETSAQIGIITPTRSYVDGEYVSQMFGNFVLVGNNDTTKKAIKCSRQCSYHDIIVHGFTDVIFYGADTEGIYSDTIQGCMFNNVICYNYNSGTIGFMKTLDCFLNCVYMWGFKYAIITYGSHFNCVYLWGLQPSEERFGFVDTQAYLYEIGDINTEPGNINRSIITNCEIGTMNVYFAGLFENVSSTKIIYADHSNPNNIQSYIFKVYANANERYKLKYFNMYFNILENSADDGHRYLSYSNKAFGYYKIKYVGSVLDSREFFIDEYLHNTMINRDLAEYQYTSAASSNAVFKICDIKIGSNDELRIQIIINSIDGPSTQAKYTMGGTGSSPSVMPQITMVRNPTNNTTCVGKNIFGISYIYDSIEGVLTLYGMRNASLPLRFTIDIEFEYWRYYKINNDFVSIASNDAKRPTIISNALCQPYDFTFTGSKTVNTVS